MRDKKILIFGAAGFLGTYLVDELRRLGKYNILASDISPIGRTYYRSLGVDYVHLDITRALDFKKLPKTSFDAVIHLAALQPASFNPRHFSPKSYVDVNVGGTANILEFCVLSKSKKIIYGSSHRNTSGLWHKNQPIREQDGKLIEYVGEYSMFGISENAAQDLVEFYRHNYPLQGIILRLPPVYGYGPHLQIFKKGKPMKTGFQTLIEKAERCMPLEIWGNAHVGRDIVYVKDVVDAIIKSIKNRSAGGLYNISSNYRLTLHEQVKTIAKVFWGDRTKPIFKKMHHRKHFLDNFTYDNGKAAKELGWRPQYNFESMLRDYRKEKEMNTFGHLITKRTKMFENK